ncbi:MAG: hypothetical protein JWN52_4648 [Actinomycetia bacterium]|nr:hypothetical protein [Actinomycetes bacterium]
MLKSWAAQKAAITQVLMHAQALPSDHDDQRLVLDELYELNVGLVVEEACELLSSQDLGQMTLGSQLLSRAVIGPDPKYRTPRVARSKRVKDLLGHLCHPGQVPQILDVALGPYSVLYPGETDLYFSLVDHSDAIVRRRALLLLVGKTNRLILDRVLSILINVLEHEPDPSVAASAMRDLINISKKRGLVRDKVARRRIEQCLRQHWKDPRPGVRVKALVAGIGDLPSAADLMLFARELEDPEVHWEFVLWCGLFHWGNPDDAERAQVVNALTRLRDQGWARQVVPGESTSEKERADMLDEAIHQVQPPPPLTATRLRARWEARRN